MSRTRPSAVEQREVAYPCDYCGAAAGRWCSTGSGWWATYLHAARWWAWRAAGGVTT